MPIVIRLRVRRSRSGRAPGCPQAISVISALEIGVQAGLPRLRAIYVRIAQHLAAHAHTYVVARFVHIVTPHLL